MNEAAPPPDDDGRWPAVFRRAREPIFILNRKRKLVFVNAAWESFTGHAHADIRGLACTRRKSESEFNPLARTLAPPKDVLDGRPASVRRPFPGSRLGPPWWDIDFLPILGESGSIAIIGRVRAPESPPAAPQATMPGDWARIRADALARFTWSAWESDEPAVRLAVAQARLVASSGCNAVVIGPPGVGKEHLARTIHAQSSRRELTFVSLDCERLPYAAIREALHGAHGLAQGDRVGLLYLRRPDLLPLDIQTELVRRPSDRFPLLAGFADEPALAVAAGTLHADLRVALSVVEIHVPRLSDRRNDIPRLAETIVARFAAAAELPVKSPDAEAAAMLASAPWPGNIDELADVLCAAMPGETAEVRAADLPLELRQPLSPNPAPQRPWPTLDTLLEAVERRMIQRALERANGNKSRAAELLGVWRPRLVRRIAALGLGPAEEAT